MLDFYSCLRGTFATALVLGVLALMTPSARAATFAVTTTADTADGVCDDDCSLREAVIAANGTAEADTILVPAGTYVLGGAGHEDLAASGDLDLRGSVSILGAGADLTILDGGANDRLIDIVESAIVSLRDLTLRNGRPPAGDTQGGGALLWNEPLSGKTLLLQLDRVVITGNSAGDGDGGGIRIDQDKPASSLITITDSIVSDNTTDDGDGGGLHLCCENLTVTIAGSTIDGNTAVDDPSVAGLNGEGGGIYHCCADTSLTIRDSTISDNDGPTQGGGIYTCCGVGTNASLTIERTTVSGNTALGTAPAQGGGGGIQGEGTVTLINSTLSGNRAFRDGGGIENEDVLVMRNVTIAGNEAGRGGGFYEDGLATTLVNVLFADNLASPGAAGNCGVAFGTDPLLSDGGNLSSDATCPLAGPGDLSDVDPLLEPLADNGGPTATHAPAVTSPAVDGGSDAGCQVLDQRGRPRPADGDNDGSARCDIGALELGSAVEDCANGIDDNANGLVDCLDLDCAGQSFCQERCDNCIDDDGDGDVDRADAECPPRSNGGGTGVANPAERGKPVVLCAGALQKAGTKITRARLKTLQSCVAKLGSCVQRKGSDARCLAKAGAGCQRSLGKLGALDAKARTSIAKSCAALTTDELLTASGLGYAAEAELCADLGVANLTDVEAASTCLLAQHACTVDRLIALESPRASELLTLGGLAPGSAIPCGAVPTTGTGVGLGARGKVLDACERTRQKAATTLVAGASTHAAHCARAVFACRQRHPSDAACLTKAQRSCARLAAKLATLTTKVAATIGKRCDAPTLAATELLGATGAGFQSQAARCKALGVPSLGDSGAITTCLIRHHQCRAQQLLERALPRLDELLTDGGITYP